MTVADDPADATLDELVGRLERAAEQLRSGDLQRRRRGDRRRGLRFAGIAGVCGA